MAQKRWNPTGIPCCKPCAGEVTGRPLAKSVAQAGCLELAPVGGPAGEVHAYDRQRRGVSNPGEIPPARLLSPVPMPDALGSLAGVGSQGSGSPGGGPALEVPGVDPAAQLLPAQPLPGGAGGKAAGLAPGRAVRAEDTVRHVQKLPGRGETTPDTKGLKPT